MQKIIIIGIRRIEADQADAVKRDIPVMVIMGNPPYSATNTNNVKWSFFYLNAKQYFRSLIN